MRTIRLGIDNGRGQTLSARLDAPLRDRPRAIAVFAHCFTCSKNLTAAVHVSRRLVERGWAVLRFDFTGLGESEGDFAETHFSSNVEDLVAVARWAEAEHGPPRLLVGHSLGGAAVLRAAEQLPSVTAVATIGAPASPDHVTKLFDRQREAIEHDGEAAVVLAGRSFTIKKAFLDDVAEQPMKQAIGGLKRALLILHSPSDSTVSVDNASTIYMAAKHPKSFVALDGADHLLTRPEDARHAADVIASWSERYLPAPHETGSVASDVTAWGAPRGYVAELTIGEHDLIADEPRELGGTDRGPSPYGYLLSALGSCTVMTLRMYADRKGWPLEQAICRMRHAKVHARDCEACAEATDDPKAKVDRIDSTLELRGDLSDEQRARLLEIADRCPVHRTLTEGPVVVVTTEVTPSA
ncbi:MAG: bifunctional alpha/beta hydrolase/OsmC family protein [Myxococcota bacterium]